MVPTVKICGLSTPETLDAAIAAGADMVGLVFFRKSPRFIEIEPARSLADRARGRAEIVALTVDMEDLEISAIMDEVRPDWLQLHGSETPERVASLKKRFRIKVMKVIGVRDKADLLVADRYVPVADRLLLDTKPPKGALRPGGNAVAFDWRLLDGFNPGLPWLLAGGLDPGNVAEAMLISRAPGVDVSSGVETAPGVKDAGLIRAFVAAARNKAPERRRERIAY